jgi:2-deoxy-D-gluconate 3-dehydrogenase
MLKKKKGKIINIASMTSFFGGYSAPAYAASKGGISQLTKTLSNDWAAQGINVNAIAPGFMATDLSTDIRKDVKRNEIVISRIAAGRWGTPDDLKGITIFLSSQASDYITGVVIPVDGGYMAK